MDTEDEADGVGGRAGRHEGAGAVGLWRAPSVQGSIGTIKKRYGVPEYTAFEVLFPDGRTKLFWEHQLEEAKEPSYRPKRWWVFW